jgi:predicted dithiol-disulfide oxidoreductase (DUF899 family)
MRRTTEAIMSKESMENHRVVSHEEWLEARTKFLAKEKEFTQKRDELSRLRRELPWEKVIKEYVFEGPGGKRTLAQLFGKKSQLIVYHFMFAPEWDEGCKHCSFWADNFDGIDVHLGHRDVTFLAISRAPLAKLEAFKKRMGWRFAWYSSFGTDFNYDYQASFRPEDKKKYFNYKTEEMDMTDREGTSVFYKDPRGAVYHTYSTYARGIDIVNGAYNFLDMAPKGRDEDHLDFTQEWVRYHDRYEE